MFGSQRRGEDPVADSRGLCLSRIARLRGRTMLPYRVRSAPRSGARGVCGEPRRLFASIRP